MGFAFFEISFILVFLLVTGGFVVILVKSIGQWNRNNHSPRLTVPATVVTKRMNVSHHHNNAGPSSHTSYYVTFQVESGDRFELSVPGQEYGLLVEGDRGDLTFQGTRFLSFART